MQTNKIVAYVLEGTDEDIVLPDRLLETETPEKDFQVISDHFATNQKLKEEFKLYDYWSLPDIYRVLYGADLLNF